MDKMFRKWEYLGTTGGVGKHQESGEKISQGKPGDAGAELG